MTDLRKRVQAKFELKNRYSNFGPALRLLRVQGFRGITDLTLAFESPVTAFSGLNGCGKSTVGQLAVCAYKIPSTVVGYKRYYVKDFFPVSAADPHPFEPDAKLEYRYETTDPGQPQSVTVSRAKTDWSGYKRQPERSVYYVGFTLYIPKVERRDLSIYRGSAIELRGTRLLSEEVKQKVWRILNQAYDELLFQEIAHRDRHAELGMASRYGANYSENNMGFGEGRVMYMVDLMESAPSQSLFILEEPETSLHEEAQCRLAEYFMDVCDRRAHQIVLSTHSSIILDALPSESLKLLLRDASGVSEFPGISSTRARAILSGGAVRPLTLCVEDTFAALVLTEILRRADATLLKAVRIEPIGDTKAVLNGVKLLRKLGYKAIGVRDGGKGASPMEGIYSLPGNRAPEIEVLDCKEVREVLQSKYSIDMETFFKLNPDVDAHTIPGMLSTQASLRPDFLNTEAVQVYVRELQPEAFDGLLKNIRTQV